MGLKHPDQTTASASWAFIYSSRADNSVASPQGSHLWCDQCRTHLRKALITYELRLAEAATLEERLSISLTLMSMALVRQSSSVTLNANLELGWDVEAGTKEVVIYTTEVVITLNTILPHI